MKLIRECRMGPPKSFKTGAVVGSYPKPMLYFQFDRGGIDVVPPKGYVPKPGQLAMDVFYEEIAFFKPGAFSMDTLLTIPDQPKVSCIDYTASMPTDLSVDYMPVKSTKALEDFQRPQSGDYNRLTEHFRKTGSVPWKTIVFDSMSGYQDIVLNHLSSFSPGSMADARQWAAMAGGKVRQLILSATSLPCHVVFIMHTQPPEADDQTKLLLELPNVFSKIRGVLGGLFSQYFYACQINGRPCIKAMDFMYVKGLGQRWPQDMNGEQPDFKSIYGKELV